jgi:hypothetical protein
LNIDETKISYDGSEEKNLTNLTTLNAHMLNISNDGSKEKNLTKLTIMVLNNI